MRLVKFDESFIVIDLARDCRVFARMTLCKGPNDFVSQALFMRSSVLVILLCQLSHFRAGFLPSKKFVIESHGTLDHSETNHEWICTCVRMPVCTIAELDGNLLALGLVRVEHLGSRRSLGSVVGDRQPVKALLVEVESYSQRFRACVFIREHCAAPTIVFQITMQNSADTGRIAVSPTISLTQSIRNCLVNAFSALFLHLEVYTGWDGFPALPVSSCPRQGRKELLSQALRSTVLPIVSLIGLPFLGTP